MTDNIKNLLGVILCLFLQILIFNRLHILGGVCFVMLIPLLKMPLSISRPLQILLGFIFGLIIDIFFNTHGLYAFSLCTLMALRLPVLKLYIDYESAKVGSITPRRVGYNSYMFYVFTAILLFCIILYGVESLFLLNVWALICKIFISLLLTFITVYLIEMICD